MQHSWESHEGDHWDWNHDSEDDGMSEQEKAGAEFMELLLQQYFGGVITATLFCMLCHWASKAGLASQSATVYGLPPGRASGKYKQHLDEKLEFRKQRRHMYHFDVPGRQRHSDDRVQVQIAARFVYIWRPS